MLGVKNLLFALGIVLLAEMARGIKCLACNEMARENRVDCSREISIDYGPKRHVS